MWHVKCHCVQMYNMPYSATHHQQDNNNTWQTEQQGFGQSQSMYNTCIGTPVAPPNAYTNQVSYPTQPRDNQFEGSSSGHMLQMPNQIPQGSTFASHPVKCQAKSTTHHNNCKVQDMVGHSLTPGPSTCLGKLHRARLRVDSYRRKDKAVLGNE